MITYPKLNGVVVCCTLLGEKERVSEKREKEEESDRERRDKGEMGERERERASHEPKLEWS